MRYIRHASLMALALLVSLFAVTSASANSDTETASSNVRARVARVNLVSGDVQVRRAGTNEWESATVNLPLIEGDQLATGNDAHAEIQIDAYNFVRIDQKSLLSIVTLRDAGVALSLAEGTATVRLSRFDGKREYFEVDAPKTTMAAENRGLYRLDSVAGGNNGVEVRITVRDGGRARIYSETSGFTLRDGRTARLFFDGTDASGDWEFMAASSLDEWDRWVEQREYYLAQRLRYEKRDRYYDSGIWGAEELDAYGDWVYAGGYGYVWRPYASVINNYYNWAPYRYGSWRWFGPFGWTWVGYEPWGWAPYHYGRWVFFNGGWCWYPYGFDSYYGSWWQPALVVWVNYGNQVCWYPVPHTPHKSNDNVPIKVPPPVATGPTKGDQAMIDKKNAGPRPPLGGAAYANAVTSIPVKDFGLIKPNIRAAPLSLGQTVIKSEPVAVTRLPVRTPIAQTGNGPLGTSANVATTRLGRDGTTGPPAASTGATKRTPGVPLDDELRRTRLLNGREPVESSGVRTESSKTGIQGTGAVKRSETPPIKGQDNEPTRPIDSTKRNDTSAGDNVAPVRPSRQIETTEPEPIQSPPIRQPPEQAPPPKYEPPARSEPPPQKYEPPPQNDPPPRYDPPQRNDPPPKSDPAPSKPSSDSAGERKGKGD